MNKDDVLKIYISEVTILDLSANLIHLAVGGMEECRISFHTIRDNKGP